LTYETAKTTGKSERFLQNHFLNALNAVMLFGTKRVAGDKKLERLFIASDLDDRTSRLIREIMVELDTAMQTLPVEQIKIDKAFKGLDLDFCDNCGDYPEENFQECMDCDTALYCSESCAMEHYSQHKPYCKRFAKTFQ